MTYDSKSKIRQDFSFNWATSCDIQVCSREWLVASGQSAESREGAWWAGIWPDGLRRAAFRIGFPLAPNH